MCIVVNGEVKPAKAGYKIMNTIYGKLYPLAFGKGEIPLGTWVNEKNHRENPSPHRLGWFSIYHDPILYETGFHVYHSKAKAEKLFYRHTRDYVALVKVKVRGVTASGYQHGTKDKVTVAKEMYVSEILHTNSKKLQRRTGCD